MTAKSDFGRKVADVYRDLKKGMESRTVNNTSGGQSGGLDQSVKEQVIGDLDRMIEHHESRKPFPGMLTGG